MSKDWTGNKATTWVTLGASNHVDHDRAEHDYYATEPKAAEELLKLEPEIDKIWECAVGGGHLAQVFDKAGKLSRISDIVKRYEDDRFLNIDFLNYNTPYYGSIVTNPPYKYALGFTKKALSLIDEGKYVAMFLKLTFLEGKERRKFFEEYPPIRIWVSSSRLKCAMNGEFDKTGSSAACYAWFIWQKGFKGKPTIGWFN